MQATFLRAVWRLRFPLVADFENEFTELAEVLEVARNDAFADGAVTYLLMEVVGVKNV